MAALRDNVRPVQRSAGRAEVVGAANLPVVNLDQLLDLRPLHFGHGLIVFICFLIMLIDGYDLAVTAQLLPAIARSFSVSTAQFTNAFAVQAIGQAMGAFALGPLADRWGRRPVLLLCLPLFGLATLASVMTATTWQFGLMRFASGALGGALMPVTIALVADFSPHRWRSSMIGVAYAGLSVGTLGAAAIVGWLLDARGWQSLFWIGGVFPMLLTLVAALWVPESPRYLARTKPRDARIGSALRLIGVRVPSGAQFTVAAKDAGGRSVPIAELFRNRRAFLTLALWVASIFSLTSVTLFQLMPSFFNELGSVPLARIATYMSFAGVGSVVGMFSAGWTMDKVGRYRALALYSLAAAMSGFALLLTPFGTTPFLVLIVWAGFSFGAAQQALNILTPTLYPSRMRAAAVGWKAGISRLASVAAPLLAGVILSSKAGLAVALIATASPMVGVAVFTPLLSRAALRAGT